MLGPINRDAKIDSRYYVRHVLSPFLNEDVSRLFQGASSRDMKFYQDSAASHTAKNTLNFLDGRNINYISPDEWIPKSLDAAPMDYFKTKIAKAKTSKSSWS